MIMCTARLLRNAIDPCVRKFCKCNRENAEFVASPKLFYMRTSRICMYTVLSNIAINYLLVAALLEIIDLIV